MSSYAVEQHLVGAAALIDAKKANAALELLTQVLSAQPTNAEAHALAARALLDLGENECALIAARAAVANDPSAARAHRMLATALGTLAKGHTDEYRHEALRAARRAVQIGPTEASNLVVLASAAASAHRFTEADEAIGSALRLAPADPNCWVNASFVAVEARNWLAAEIAARRALTLDPPNYAATNNLGLALRQQGRWTLAAAVLYDAAAVDPGSAPARYNVEGIGFQYLMALSVIPLIPLLIVWPVFLGARIGTERWLAGHPRRLQPLARKIGIRVSRSTRARARLARHNAAVAGLVATPGLQGVWSATRGYRSSTNNGLRFVARFAFALAVIFPLADIAVPTTSGHIGLGIAAIVALSVGMIARRVIRNRHLLRLFRLSGQT